MDIRASLLLLADPSYAAFSSRLIPGCKKLLGVRLPLLRKLAKTLLTEDWRAFSLPKDPFFEETMLFGMLIGMAEMPVSERIARTRAFLPLINNWSVCDSFCATLKATLGNPIKNSEAELLFWNLAVQSLRSDEEFTVRFGAVLCLDCFLKGKRAHDALSLLAHASHPGYYAKMAVAWAIAETYLTLPQEVETLFIAKSLDPFIQNKAISKIRDSYRVSNEAKERLKLLRRPKSSKA